MKNKTIYSLLVTAILVGAIFPMQTQAIADILTWHYSLEDQTIAWRITEQYLFDPAEPPTLGGRDLILGSLLAFEINDTLPIYYSEVYNSAHPPNFLKLYVDYQEVSFYDINEGMEPSFALQYLIIPYLFYPASTGVTSNITTFLEYRASLDPNITAIDYVITGGNYVQVSIFNDFIDSFVITYNNNTGICSNFFIEDDFGEMYGELDIWESEIDDDGVDTTTSALHFHPNIGDGTKLSWKYTEITYDPLALGEMEVNNVTLEVGHVFSFVYGLIPTYPSAYYGMDFSDPSHCFFDVYFETELMEWTHVNRAMVTLWLTLINPLSVTLYNGTVFPMEVIPIIRDSCDPGIYNTFVSSPSDNFITLEYDFEEENDLWAVDLNINTNSGIVQNLAVDILGFVHFEMAFAPENSTLLIDGTINTDGGDHTTRTLPGFNWFYLLFSSIAVLPIIRRRKK